MSKRRMLRHILADLGVVALVLGVPFFTSDWFRAKVTGADAVSGATTVIEAPSGDYLVLLNSAALEEDAFWETFFVGDEVGYCFEDITCMIGSGDTGAADMAASFCSRLPEDQMRVRIEDITLMLSRADSGRFQVILLSQEMAERTGALSAVENGAKAVTFTGKDGEAP